MGNGEGRSRPSDLPTKELVQCFSDFFIKKVDDIQTRQVQRSDNAPDVPTEVWGTSYTKVSAKFHTEGSG